MKRDAVDDRGGPAPATSGKVVRSGTGSKVRLGRGEDPLVSRGFAKGSVSVRPAKVDEASVRAAEQDIRDEQMAKSLKLSRASYGRAVGRADGGKISKSAGLTDRELASARESKIAGPATKRYAQTEVEFRSSRPKPMGIPQTQPEARKPSRFESVGDDDSLRAAPMGQTGRGLAAEAAARAKLRLRDIDKAADGYSHGGKIKTKGK